MSELCHSYLLYSDWFRVHFVSIVQIISGPINMDTSEYLDILGLNMSLPQYEND